MDANQDDQNVVIWSVRVSDCPYCHQDHGDVEFYGCEGDDKLMGICKNEMGVIVAEREA